MPTKTNTTAASDQPGHLQELQQQQSEKIGHLHELQQRPRLGGLRLLHVQPARHGVVGRHDQLEGSRRLLARHDGDKALAANRHALRTGAGGGVLMSCMAVVV